MDASSTTRALFKLDHLASLLTVCCETCRERRPLSSHISARRLLSVEDGCARTRLRYTCQRCLFEGRRTPRHDDEMDLVFARARAAKEAKSRVHQAILAKYPGAEAVEGLMLTLVPHGEHRDPYNPFQRGPSINPRKVAARRRAKLRRQARPKEQPR
ncbi:hypothetical protein SAMN07250955_10653 [Arboricoccus pini]|uniref:Uncharacterized protein n=1 Tax=Arboricoccus pini TaxID=1963835 RepID=A0A212R6P8_9PROT|nr:hypothetical protein SAMN07250955_10653 [Arboricoccus pini]